MRYPKASACLAAERCGDVVTACLTVVIVSDVCRLRGLPGDFRFNAVGICVSKTIWFFCLTLFRAGLRQNECETGNHGITTFEIGLHHKRTMLSTPGHAVNWNGKAYASKDTWLERFLLLQCVRWPVENGCIYLQEPVYDGHMISGTNVAQISTVEGRPGKTSIRKLTPPGIEFGPAAWDKDVIP